MKIFHCGGCESLVFFENTSCVHCGHALGFLPDRMTVAALEPVDEGRWRPVVGGAEREGEGGTAAYRLCRNYSDHDVCNWLLADDDPNPYCRSCRVTRVIPDLERPGARELWAALEAAKRRMMYSLLRHDLPVASKEDDPECGLEFEFLADSDVPGAPRVLTGHDEGRITINIAEADDAEREKRRHAMKEGYRTLLGHFRHEIGHYYWDRLIRDSPRLDEFRRLFGDESEDYNQALQRHHRRGAPADWPNSFVSAYASSHPWEDWAETWAHYLHMTDTLETAEACGLSLRPGRADEPTLTTDGEPEADEAPPSPAFDRMVEHWFALTYALNNLNRGMGLKDAYPFVLPRAAVAKLRFVHDVVADRPARRAGLLSQRRFCEQ